MNVVVAKNGDGSRFALGFELSDSRIGLDLEIEVPKKSPVSVKTDKET
jgi:hypothetical protein